MPRRTYDLRKGRQRPSGDRTNYSQMLIDELNKHRQVTRPGGRTKQGDPQE